MFEDITTPKEAQLAAINLIQQRIRLFDTETTGLLAEDEIIQLSVVTTDNGTIFDERFKPQQAIDQNAFELHRMSEYSLRNCYPIEVYWDRILTAMNGKVLGAWNKDFDVRLLKQTMTRYKLAPSPDATVGCIMKLYSIYSQRSSKYVKLQEAARELHLGLFDAHDANADAKMVARILHRIADGFEPDMTSVVNINDKRRFSY